MRLLLDEMWSYVVAEQLRLRGHDVESVQQRLDLVEQSDRLLLRVAEVEQRAILTENIKDFREISAAHIGLGHMHYGLIYTTDHRYPRRDPRTIGRIVTALDALLTANPDLTNREHWLS